MHIGHLICAGPSQQPAPIGTALSYSAIWLTWRSPDSANSNKLNYTLIRDGHSVYTIQSHYPFSKYPHSDYNFFFLCYSKSFSLTSFQDNESFEDTGLSPYTNYTYWLITANVAGSTISASASYRTLGAPPAAEELHLKLVGRSGPTSAHLSWSTPSNATGPVER